MRKTGLASMLALVAASGTLAGCEQGYGGGYGGPRGYGPPPPGYAQYDYDRPDPAYNGYYADRYYRDGPNYREHQLAADERLYRGQDGRYYCRRSDGTTGLVVGAGAGALLGAVLAPGGSGLAGALIGGIVGGAAGTAVDAGKVRCR